MDQTAVVARPVPDEVLLQAVGEGATPSRLLGGSDPALVLLIGLNSMAERDVE